MGAYDGSKTRMDMKPVKAWAIVDKGESEIYSYAGRFEIYQTRKDANVFGASRQPVRVEIREVTPKRKKEPAT